MNIYHKFRAKLGLPQALGKLQTAWVEDLESGHLSQVYDMLGNDAGFCCLGVATFRTCNVPIIREEDEYGSKKYAAIIDGIHETTVLPSQIVTKMKFYDHAGLLKLPRNVPKPYNKSSNSAVYELSSMNDGGWTFAEIAAFVRAHPSWVFSEPA